MHKLRLGTRGSRLALWQADFAAAELQRAVPELEVQCRTIKTSGDKNLSEDIFRTEEKGGFSAEIEKSLLDGKIDAAVHSLKDLPSRLDDDLCIGAVLERESPYDALLSAKGYTFASLPYGSTLGTSSPRRTAQVKSRRPDINIEPVRGNIETRIKKMQEQGFDGILLAFAGIKRLGLEHMISEIIPPDIILPAVGQGAIAVEVRKSDTVTRGLLKKISNEKARLETDAERGFLQHLHGRCRVPVACMATLLQEGALDVQGLVASVDGSRVIKSGIRGDADDAVGLGKKLAEKILIDGAGKILEDILKNCS